MRWQKSKKFLAAFFTGRFPPFIWLIHTGCQTSIRSSEMATKRRPSMRTRMKVEDVSSWVTHNQPTYSPNTENHVRFDVPKAPKGDSDKESVVSLTERPVYYDGGYGWIIVLSSFLMHAICDGASFCFGIVFVKIQDEFSVNQAVSSFAASLFLSLPLLLSPIAGICSDIKGCRFSIMLGAGICTFSCLLALFASNIWVFTIVFGLGCGIGMSFIYNAAICIVTYYFDKKRGLATSMAVSGTGLGTCVFPFYMSGAIHYLSPYLSDLQTILVALVLAFTLILVVGYFINDVEWESDSTEFKIKQFERNSKALMEDQETNGTKKEKPPRHAISLPNLNLMRMDHGSIHSICDAAVEAKNEKPARSKSVAIFDNQQTPMQTIPEYSMLNTYLVNLEHLDLELANSPCTTVKAARRRVFSKASMSVDQINELDDEDFKIDFILTSTESDESISSDSSSDDTEMSNDGDSSSSELSEKPSQPTTKLLNKNLENANVRASSSAPTSARVMRNSLAPGASNISGGRVMASNALQVRYMTNLLTMGKIPSAPMLVARKKRRNVLLSSHNSIIRRFLETELPLCSIVLKNKAYRYLIASVVFLYLVLDVPYVIFYDYAQSSYNMTNTMADAVYSTIGMCNFVSTIAYGKINDWDTDKKYTHLIYSFSMVAVGVMMLAANFVTDAVQLIVCGGLFGVFVSSNYVLQSILITICFDGDMNVFQGAYSLIGMTEGVASLLGPFIFAKIRVMTGSYAVVFVVGFFCSLVSAFFAFLFHLELLKQANEKQANSIEEGADPDFDPIVECQHENRNGVTSAEHQNLLDV